MSIAGVEITVFVAEVEQNGGLGMHKKAALRASFLTVVVFPQSFSFMEFSHFVDSLINKNDKKTATMVSNNLVEVVLKQY